MIPVHIIFTLYIISHAAYLICWRSSSTFRSFQFNRIYGVELQAMADDRVSSETKHCIYFSVDEASWTAIIFS